MIGLHKRFSDGRKKDDHCEKNDNYSVMNTLLDIDKARRCSASAVRYKNL